MLQDIRVDSLKLPWDSWLTWLEGQPLEIPLPRSFFAENKFYRGTAGVFCVEWRQTPDSPTQEAQSLGVNPREQNEPWTIQLLSLCFASQRFAQGSLFCAIVNPPGRT